MFVVVSCCVFLVLLGSVSWLSMCRACGGVLCGFCGVLVAFPGSVC